MQAGGVDAMNEGQEMSVMFVMQRLQGTPEAMSELRGTTTRHLAVRHQQERPILFQARRLSGSVPTRGAVSHPEKLRSVAQELLPDLKSSGDHVDQRREEILEEGQETWVDLRLRLLVVASAHVRMRRLISLKEVGAEDDVTLFGGGTRVLVNEYSGGVGGIKMD